ncbi:hypothetical protein ABFX02_12G105100 [Erythranthe guttata]
MNLEVTPTKSDETEIDTPPHTHTTQPYKFSSFTRGALKNHHHQPPPPAAAAVYKECMKNHAAGLGGHAVDGCCEYMPHTTSSATSITDPTLLKCAACGCHRNFHRRQPDFSTAAAAVIAPPFLDFRLPAAAQPHPKRISHSTSPESPHAAPPPHHKLQLALSTAVVVAADEHHHHQEPVTPTAENPSGRKRSRTKFSREQKEKLHSFSEKLGWKIQKSDEAAAEEFCREVGVAKSVLRVWMHNHRNVSGKKDRDIIIINNNGGKLINSSSENNNNGGNSSSENEEIRNINKWQSFSE